ncbi:alpha-1-antichymotrypsin-like isoform X1 [Dromiciops gliroides]|uniref:alpha-1-antichymotrypsin-like isoform X1 n=1 Tax=Dromiciops gliroides TaxID=33562 RepID=UPI001CC6E6B7|nr:alpha-1-antichymotrypsin-like isoform X1 [Dromiciops gliroides]
MEYSIRRLERVEVGKMQSTYLLGLFIAVFCATGLGHPDSEKAPTDDLIQEEQRDVINRAFSVMSTSNAEFAFHLYKKLASENPMGNVLFSPLSLSIAFALLSLGAGGTTKTQILEGLRFNLTEIPEAEIHRGFQELIQSFNISNNGFKLNTGNALFIGKNLELLEKFQGDSKSLYSTEAFSTDFLNPELAKKQINDYVKNQTQGKIPQLFDSLEENTVMVLVNYIFFKAKWETPFHPSDTHTKEFYVSEEKVIEVPMMYKNKLFTRVFQDKELFCTVVELKYIGNATALFILPDEKKMKDVEDALSSEVLNKWKNSLKQSEIKLFLPRFSISRNYELQKILPTMGIEDVFTNRANLSGITEQNIKVSKVVHKAVMDVDEAGTEASAATGMQFVFTSLRMIMPPVITFNRPFLIILCNERDVIFMGKVRNPLKA